MLVHRREVRDGRSAPLLAVFDKYFDDALMSESWPGNVCLHCPSRTSHS